VEIMQMTGRILIGTTKSQLSEARNKWIDENLKILFC